MRRSTRTAPLFIAMAAALAFAVPGYGALVAPTGTTTSVGEPVPAFAWNAVTGADHYTFELDSGASLTFLVADEGDWPKEWYARLGFDAIGRRYELLRI